VLDLDAIALGAPGGGPAAAGLRSTAAQRAELQGLVSARQERSGIDPSNALRFQVLTLEGARVVLDLAGSAGLAPLAPVRFATRHPG